MFKPLTMESKYSPLPGDVLVRNKSTFGIIDHYGLYVGYGKVIDNHPERGVCLISVESFLSGRKLVRIARFEGNPNERNQVVQRANSMLGLNYHLTDFNCEHFVNEVWGAGRSSQQLATAVVLILFSAAIWGLSKLKQI